MLGWTRDWGRAQQLAWRLAVLYAEEFQALGEPLAAVKPWLLALQKAAVPCALVSHMPAAQLKVAARLLETCSFSLFQLIQPLILPTEMVWKSVYKI